MLRNENTQVKLYGFDGRGYSTDLSKNIWKLTTWHKLP